EGFEIVRRWVPVGRVRMLVHERLLGFKVAWKLAERRWGRKCASPANWHIPDARRLLAQCQRLSRKKAQYPALGRCRARIDLPSHTISPSSPNLAVAASQLSRNTSTKRSMT